jgi:hypothetical protein
VKKEPDATERIRIAKNELVLLETNDEPIDLDELHFDE